MQYLTQIVAGVLYLHTEFRNGAHLPICHGDLHGKNILLTGEAKKTVKICDYENCHLLLSGETNASGLKPTDGMAMWMSPEKLNYLLGDNAVSKVVRQTGIGRRTDIWSVGCIALEMFGRGEIRYRTHFGGGDVVTFSAMDYVDKGARYRIPSELWESIVQDGARPDWSDADKRQINPGLRKIINGCLQWDPEKLDSPKRRPDAAQLHQQLTSLAVQINYWHQHWY